MQIFTRLLTFFVVLGALLLSVSTEALARSWRSPRVLAPRLYLTWYDGALYEIGGYGEYAEYGPWANTGPLRNGCRPGRIPVLTEAGWLYRRVEVCF